MEPARTNKKPIPSILEKKPGLRQASLLLSRIFYFRNLSSKPFLLWAESS
jgi:hypothetical protein